MSDAVPKTNTLEPGTPFGRYVITRLIGNGGMATVYEAKHLDLNKRVALKTLHQWLTLRADVVKRFVQEARTAARIQHPHVLAIYDIGIEQGVPFMAMDLLEGEELAGVIHREGALPLERVAAILLPVISALRAAHDAGVLHRDLKPENIFLARRKPQGEYPVLLDFGISKVRDSTLVIEVTAADELLGTPEYMAPEQVLGGMNRFDALSDQYAIGVVLYQAACGLRPFRNDASVTELLRAIAQGGAPPPSTIMPSIPTEFDALVARAMNNTPEQRFPTLTELGRALLPFAGPVARAVWAEDFGAPLETVGISVSAPPPGRSTPTPPPPKRGTPPPPAPVVGPRELRVVPCFAERTDAELDALIALAPPARVADGATLFDEGADASSCFILVTGEIDIGRSASETWWLATLRPGALLGQTALLEDAPRSVSAIAKETSVVIELGRDVFERLRVEQPDLAGALIEQIAINGIRRLRAATERVAHVEARPERLQALTHLHAVLGEWSLPLEEGGRRPVKR